MHIQTLISNVKFKSRPNVADENVARFAMQMTELEAHFVNELSCCKGKELF